MSDDLSSPRALGDPLGGPDPAGGAAPGSVTLVIPTRDEAGTVGELLRRIGEALPVLPPCRVLFVDDSTDSTPEAIAKAAPACPFPVTVLRRETAGGGSGGGGSGGAVAEGMARAVTDWIVVMDDASRRHLLHLVPGLVGTGERTGAALVVASRHPGPGSSGGGRSGGVPRGATRLVKALFPRALRGIGDPMSGFFAVRRSAVAGRTLRPVTDRVLLEVAVRCRPAPVAEVPVGWVPVPEAPAAPDRNRDSHRNRDRNSHRGRGRYPGGSGAALREGLRFLTHLAALRSATPLARMIGFGLIGLTGFVPNLAALWLLTHAGMHYLPAGVVANQAGVLWNFLLIETLLFRDRRRHRHWADRVGRFALLANADLLLRIPLIALLVTTFGMAVLPATALALVTTFVLRFAATEALVYLPRRTR